MPISVQKREKDEVKELFNCTCHSLSAVCMLYYLPSICQNEEDEVIYFNMMKHNWRNRVCLRGSEITWPSFWGSVYWNSIWKRIEIAAHYIFTNNNKNILFEQILLDHVDADRFLKVLATYGYENTSKDVSEIVFHAIDTDCTAFELRMRVIDHSIKGSDDKLREGIILEIFFRKNGMFKRFKYALKYLFGYRCHTYEEQYCIDKKKASQLARFFETAFNV